MKTTSSLNELLFGPDEDNRYLKPKEPKKYQKPVSPYERAETAAYATGNKWTIENFHKLND